MNFKLLTLTVIVLALTACGGGGGGGSSTADNSVPTSNGDNSNSGDNGDESNTPQPEEPSTDGDNNANTDNDNSDNGSTDSGNTGSGNTDQGNTGGDNTDNTGNGDNTTGNNDGSDNSTINQAAYYADAIGQSGYSLKTALSTIINQGHNDRGYNWVFVNQNDRDIYFENDSTILDIYSENPASNDPYTFDVEANQCGNYRAENDCYNREHAFPQSWFDKDYPMRSDVHHLFASDGYVNGRRSNHPFGEVSSASWTSRNGSRLGTGNNGSFTGTVFEPIDEFKGDLARAYFYMATRYESQIAAWENNGTAGNVLNGTSNQVFDNWHLNLLKQWHNQDPVSTKERDRNQAAFAYQGNRNPFIDNPQWVSEIWGE